MGLLRARLGTRLWAARARGYDRFVFVWEVEPPSGFTLGGK